MSENNESQNNTTNLNRLLGGLAEVLEGVLDKGAAVGGDVIVGTNEDKSLPIKLRLIATSVDKAQEIGMDWWANDPYLNSNAAKQDQGKLQEVSSQTQKEANKSQSEKSEEITRNKLDNSEASEEGKSNKETQDINASSSNCSEKGNENEVFESRLQRLEDMVYKIIEMNNSGEEKKEEQSVTEDEQNEQQDTSEYEKNEQQDKNAPLKNTQKGNKGKTNPKNEEIQ